MKFSRLQFVSMLVFIAGFVCANSGWSAMIAIWQSDRPAWSVCGEDLCLCVKPTEQEPFCPLCISSDDAAMCSESDSSSDTNPPRRLPRTPHNDAISHAAQHGCASIFIAFAFGHAPIQTSFADAHRVRFVDPDSRLALSSPDTPTPPPRS